MKIYVTNLGEAAAWGGHFWEADKCPTLRNAVNENMPTIVLIEDERSNSIRDNTDSCNDNE